MSSDTSNGDHEEPFYSSHSNVTVSYALIAQQFDELSAIAATIRDQSEDARIVARNIREEARRMRELASSVSSGMTEPKRS